MSTLISTFLYSAEHQTFVTGSFQDTPSSKTLAAYERKTPQKNPHNYWEENKENPDRATEEGQKCQRFV